MTDFVATKYMFHLSRGMVCLDGNSLGPLPKAAPAAMEAAMRDKWGEMLIISWNNAGWIEISTSVGDRVARLVGFNRGTGGTGGVNYLKRMLEVAQFPKLWHLRASL